MEALLYSVAVISALLILSGIYLLVKRVRGHKSAIEIKGFGTIKTAHHGVALVFLGIVLFAQSLTGLQQRDELKRNLDRLENSNALIVSFLAPSLLANTAFQNYFKTAPADQQQAILQRTLDMLRPEFRRVTDAKRTGFRGEDFGDVASLYNFLLSVYSKDGSGLYYKGEVQRLLRKRHLMRENFNLYLSNAPAPKAALSGLKAQAYFDERTAWVQHLLANDFLCEAVQSSNPETRNDLLQRVWEKAGEIRKYRPQGFDAGETALSTTNLERAVRDGIDKIPKPACPEMR